MAKLTPTTKDFLLINGATLLESTDDMDSFDMFGIGITIEDNEIVFFGEEGDFEHIPNDLYALVDALIEYYILKREDIRYSYPPTQKHKG